MGLQTGLIFALPCLYLELSIASIYVKLSVIQYIKLYKYGGYINDMSQMRKQSCNNTSSNRNQHFQQSERIRMYKSMFRILYFRPHRFSLRIMRYGKRQNKNIFKNKGNPSMSNLRSSILEHIRILGNQSGCHQLPERSFFYKGKQFPICARCTGVVIGQMAAILTASFYPISLITSIILILIMGFDWFIQMIGLKKSTNPRRFVTGICGGFGVFSVYIIIAKTVLKMLKRTS